MNTIERVIRNVQGTIVIYVVVGVLIILGTALAVAQWPAPSSEPPITWNPSTDTLTITRGDVMVCLPQVNAPPACRFAKWWTEKEIR